MPLCRGRAETRTNVAPHPSCGTIQSLVRPFRRDYRRDCHGGGSSVDPASRIGRGRGDVVMASAFSRADRFGAMALSAANDEIEEYRPSGDEPFMSLRQQAYFRRKLTQWRDAIRLEAQGTLSQLQVDSMREADLNDRASTETDWSIELRTRDRQRKLIGKIEAALRRIDEGEYGYCEVTGEPISLGRLEARPIATMTVEAQERHERHEKVSRED